MLIELRIRDFALIDALTVRLAPGLNVLSGETGAGKSIIVGALSLLLGERASADVVRAGSSRAVVEGVFDLGGRPELAAWLEERGIEPEDGLVILRREVAAEGRNRAWINGAASTAGMVGEIGGALVDLHGQHEHQTLLRRPEQRAILDAYGKLDGVVARVGEAHAALARTRADLATLETRRREGLQRADFLRHQVEEIAAAAPRPGEEEELEGEARRLSHAEELLALAGGLAEALREGEGALVDRLGSLRRDLDQLLRIDEEQGEMAELFDTAYYALEELGSRLGAYAASVDHDPARLEEMRRRQDLLYRLRTKYGSTLEEVLAVAGAAQEELDSLDSAEWEAEGLRTREGELAREMEQLAASLTELRADCAGRLAGEVGELLPALGMEGGRFEVALLPLAEQTAAGAEEVEFRVALNRGFDPRPLAQVASGGELSRVMLSLKTILARLDAVPTLVFDEVDAGIGGKVAVQVGARLQAVARSHQVFVVTHLPQIASKADAHLRVSKSEREGVGVTLVETLEGEERVAEIARMLGGDPESHLSRDHARELLGAVGG
jgi:DNA repair protein RecN (Recombination protein N)